MVVLPEAMSSFELRLGRAELVFSDKTRLQEQFHRVVQGGAAHPVLRLFHAAIEPFDVEVPFLGIDLLEDGETFRGFPVPPVLQIVAEDPLHVLLERGRYHREGEGNERCRGRVFRLEPLIPLADRAVGRPVIRGQLRRQAGPDLSFRTSPDGILDMSADQVSLLLDENGFFIDERIISLPMSRYMPLILLSFFPAVLSVAQKPLANVYFIHFSMVVSGTQEKFVHEAMRAQDPDPILVIDPPAQCAYVNTMARLDRTQLQSELNACGLIIDHFERIMDEAPVLRSERPRVIEAWPAYVSTGDPVMDNARYDLLKRVFIAEHPEAYEGIK